MYKKGGGEEGRGSASERRGNFRAIISDVDTPVIVKCTKEVEERKEGGVRGASPPPQDHLNKEI